MAGGAKEMSGKPAEISDLVKIEHPFHGAVINRSYGREVDGGLRIEVQGQAPRGSSVIVNGIPANAPEQDFCGYRFCVTGSHISLLRLTDGSEKTDTAFVWCGTKIHFPGTVFPLMITSSF